MANGGRVKGNMSAAALFLVFIAVVQAGKYDLDPNDKAAVRKEELAEENPKLFEGDIVMSKAEVDRLTGSSDPRAPPMPEKRESLTDRRRHWPNAVVPYVISGSIDSKGRGAIFEAIKHYKQHTCIKLVQRSSQKDYIRFIKGRGCYSLIGRSGGLQDVSIGEGCQYLGTVVHEIMHALGFYHEQSRLDRDQYITIYWNNIMQGMAYNFNKYRRGVAESLGEKYDTSSIMHYGSTAFGIGGRVTIKAKDGSKLGNRQSLSASDKRHLNTMYKCSGGGGGGGGNDCKDKRTECPGWAKYCTFVKYKSYMQENCCKTCKASVVSNCEDKQVRCPEWVKYCTSERYKSWMSQNCCKTCKEGTTGGCKDKFSKCSTMANGAPNICTISLFKTWMKANCCASCS